MRGFKRYSSADSENIREKNLQKFIDARAQRQPCSATVAPIQVEALVISLKLANALLQVQFCTKSTM
jgi:hypothetical protein